MLRRFKVTLPVDGTVQSYISEPIIHSAVAWDNANNAVRFALKQLGHALGETLKIEVE